MVDINMVCPFCGSHHSVTVDEMQYTSWQRGTLIQRAMPTLSETEREQLISHICPKCQEKFFGIEEDEEDISACLQESLEFTGQWW